MNLENKIDFSGTTYSVVDPNIYEVYKQTGDGELFEKLVSDLILNKYSDDPDINKYINSLGKKDQRLAIMSLIDKETKGDSNLLWSEMKSYVESAIDKTEHIKDVVRIINKFVKDGTVEKKKHGEVMTPITLVREMLDTLPKEVWSNPNLKWLDPANGAGTFPFVIIYKLMNGLKDWEPDTEKRYKHIVENMIYVCELQSRNVFLWLCGVDPKDEYTTNTYWGSFLEEGFDKHMREVWKVDKFDIVVGNPPYNGNGTGNGNTIWHLFLEKADIISRRYINMVHPSSWRMPLKEGDRFYVSSKIIKNSATYLRILNKEESNKYFGLSIKVDYYLIDKINSSNLCIVETINKKIEIDIRLLPFIPNGEFETFSRVINGVDKCVVVYSYMYDPRNKYVSSTKSDEYIYTLVHTTPKSGTRFMYSSISNKGHFGIPKVIFGDSGIYDVIIDINGDYGMTQHSIGIEIYSIEEAEELKRVLLSDKFNKFIESVTWSNYQIDWRIFTYLNKNFYKEF